MGTLLIRNGRVLDPANKRDGNYDILIKDGKIAQVAPEISAEADHIYDATGLLVMPGLIDMHVHFREPGLEYKETIATGTAAAAKGGFTTVCPMANTKPVIDCVEMVQKLKAIIDRDAKVHVLMIGTVTKGLAGKEVCDLAAMKQAGIRMVSEDGKSVMDSGVYAKAMEICKEEDILVLAHCEDINLVRGGVMHEGVRSKELGLPGITSEVEDIITARDIFLARQTGARLHLCHCSTKTSVEMVRMAKEAGLPVSAEVCPHHFTLCDEDIPGDDGNYKMNPPLRGREDLEALRAGLSSGVMEVISTDHAPHAAQEKEGSMKTAAFGIVGLETSFALAWTELVKTGLLTPMQLVERMSAAPARILKIRAGALSVGYPADITIADPNQTYRIDKNTFVSKGKNTPFDGREVTGEIAATVVDGRIVYERKK
ncbi:MAG: dihydroorotase [Lachnospiraceae bacterium]|nr:dihydroorotase [Lachnospiraceae bacterium]